jgi:hypothetical protein
MGYKGVVNNLQGGGVSVLSANHIAVTADFTSATWNIFTTPKHEVFTVTGIVRVWTWAECTGSVDSAGHGATIAYGHEAATSAFIAATDETTIDVGELWYATGPATKAIAFATAVFDWVLNGLDIGYEIGVEALTEGSIVFHCVWVPLSDGATVAAGAGGTL